MQLLHGTADAAPLSGSPTETAMPVSLPTEILLTIIRTTLTSALLSPTLVVHGQFAQVPTTCSGCVYRRLACVSRTWRDSARKVLVEEVVLAAGCDSAERDEQVLHRLETSPDCALAVRSIDASLRGVHGAGWIPVPELAVGERGEPDGSSGADAGVVAGLSTEQARWERWHEHCMARERCRLARILSLCTHLSTLDVDVAFFHNVVPSGAPGLPTSIRRLTLRNAGALETVAILHALPRLEALTLRLALDWRLPPSHQLVPELLPQLRRFELSTTAFGKPCLASIRAILSNSAGSLTSLAFRNKAASAESLRAFRSAAAEVLYEAGSHLEELAIQDVPSHRSSSIGSVLARPDWFLPGILRLPRLRRLHLTGSTLPDIGFFTRTIAVPDQQLERLTVEHFGSPFLAPLADALEDVPAVQNLRELAVAVTGGDELARTAGGSWQKQQRRIEDWCSRPKGAARTPTRLSASWRMSKVEGSGRW